MPIYEFICPYCGNEEEVLMSINDDGKKCNSCGKKMKKIISHSTFVLKGGGWYNDGYSKRKE